MNMMAAGMNFKIPLSDYKGSEAKPNRTETYVKYVTQMSNCVFE